MKETIAKNIDPRQLDVFNDYLSTLDDCNKTNAITIYSDGGPPTGNVKITVLPPGEAYGCHDGERWALRRMNGQSGLPLSRKERKQLQKKRKLDAADRWMAKRQKRRR